MEQKFLYKTKAENFLTLMNNITHRFENFYGLHTKKEKQTQRQYNKTTENQTRNRY